MFCAPIASHHHPSAVEEAITRFSMHIDLWQVWPSHLQIYQLHDILARALDVCDVRGAWTTWLPFAMRWYIKSISSCMLFLWKTKDVSKKLTKLALPYIIHKRFSVGHGINSNVGYAVLSFYPKHDPVAGGGSKSVDFAFHV